MQMQLDKKWQISDEAKTIYNNICLSEVSGLFSPDNKDSSVETKVKITCVGKSGVGKSSIVCRLAGWDMLHKHVATVGIQVIDCKWPVKVEDKENHYVMHFFFWDFGGTVSSQFKYLTEEAHLETEVILYMFSPVDYASFDMVKKQLDKDKDLPVVQIVVITKCDLLEKWAVSVTDIEGLHTKFDVQIFRMSNFPSLEEPFFEQMEVINLMDAISIAVIRKREISP